MVKGLWQHLDCDDDYNHKRWHDNDDDNNNNDDDDGFKSHWSKWICLGKKKVYKSVFMNKHIHHWLSTISFLHGGTSCLVPTRVAAQMTWLEVNSLINMCMN